ncbi:hypothetical protein [Pseudomonas nabeulensis]|uniref:hypothetical protein n=1 Tax=Pseudomonas nabeulensis TaxID=2293833 RepID=UPI001EE7F677|nr:hypothetical protein [Pseudomonas nabeulensis]
MVFPQTYEQWRHCITVECGIALTPAFIAQRLASSQKKREGFAASMVTRIGDL